jgi:hypothetical protein
MSNFKKNRPTLHITEKGNNIINKAEDIKLSTSKYVKEITVPFTQEMSELLEKIFIHFDSNISRRKLCSKYLLKSLKSEAENLN